MKKIFLTFFILLFVFTTNADIKFIKARFCPMLEYPTMDSKRIGMLKLNDTIKVIKNVNEFYEINYKDSICYIKSDLCSDNELTLISYSGKVDLTTIEVRKRASNFASSAAAGRGLAQENIRDRNNISFKEYDFDSIKWIENNFNFSDKELILFFEKELLNY